MNILLLAFLVWTVALPIMTVAAALIGRRLLERRSHGAPVAWMPAASVPVRRPCEGRSRVGRPRAARRVTRA